MYYALDEIIIYLLAILVKKKIFNMVYAAFLIRARSALSPYNPKYARSLSFLAALTTEG
jgi:hypothetical protein